MSRQPGKKSIHCPRCGQSTLLTENPFRPFCSEKCRMIDLGRWAGEEYRIPGERVDRDPASAGQVLSFPGGNTGSEESK